jgi:WD40 repeat protein
VLTDDDEGVLRVWNPSTGALVGRAPDGSRGPLAVSPDGRLLAARTTDGAIGVWSIPGLRRLREITREGPFNAAAFSPDGHLIATAGADGTVRLFAARTGKPVSVFGGHADGVTAIRFSDDGQLLVTASRDNDARIWDVLHRRQGPVLQGHSGEVLDASFSPDHRRVVTAGPASAGVWDASSGDSLAFLGGDTDQLTAASFSPDGSTILTASVDGTVRTYVCDVCGVFDQLAAAADARLAEIARPLTPAQRDSLIPSANGA